MGARQVEQGSAPLLSTYRTTAADLRRCLILADIAADGGNARRAAEYLIGALDELALELAELRANRRG